MATEQRALVTGASRGLGRALTEQLVHDGWHVIVDARDPADLLSATAPLPRVHALAGDVADPAHRARLAELVELGGGLDLLVNNASTLGVSPLPSLTDYPLDELERVLRVNTLAPLALIQRLLPMLRPGARVLNVSSDAAVEAYPGWGGYGASKAALDQLSAVLAAENPELRVYAVDPGDMRTDMHQRAYPGEDINDRPLPDTVVPALRRLIEGELPSGRYRAGDLLGAREGPAEPAAYDRTAEPAARDRTADPAVLR
jgi:NAD(P)-dependent dehydrogenase (short-subunit alcohol dehydrogenase family)